MRSILFAAAIAAVAGGPVMAADEARPVHLDVQESGDGVVLTVVGDAGATADARFDLEVASTGAGGTTRTVQSGTNRKGGAGGVLLRSSVNTSGLREWTAKLRVQSEGREYSETRSNAG